MSSIHERLVEVFTRAFILEPSNDVALLEYQGIPQWDSLGHMALVADIEDEFQILIGADDVIDMSSFAAALEIVERLTQVQ